MVQPLSAALELCQALEERQVRFMHWKSNLHLAEGLAGTTDLDLLIHRDDGAAFAAAITELGGLRIQSQPWASYPGVEDWLIFDGETGAFLHLHVHFDMVTGLKRVKHLVLPWTDTMFANSRADPATGFPIPAAEMELLVLLVRIWAKMPPRQRLLGPRIPPHILAELRWLESQADATRLPQLAAALGLRSGIRLPLGDEEAVIGLARRLYGELSSHYRMGWPAALVRAGQLNLRLQATRLWLGAIGPVRYRKTLIGGGAMVAVIGSDGSGKSTVSRSLETWLRYKLDVHLLYMGSGDGRAGVINGLRRRISALAGKKRKEGRVQPLPPPAKPVSFAGKTYRLLDYLLLRRKLRLLRLGRRLADQGSVILLDRYPQHQFPAVSDGPRQQDGRGFAWAAAAERKLFNEAARLGPDLVLKLRIDPETAQRRKPDHDLQTIRRKCAITELLEFPRAVTIDIDAALSPEAVVGAAKRAIWAHLQRQARR